MHAIPSYQSPYVKNKDGFAAEAVSLYCILVHELKTNIGNTENKYTLHIDNLFPESD